MGDAATTPDPNGEKPDVDMLFGAKDVDDLFPADYKPTNQPVRNVSPIQDMLFANPGRSHARVLDAFGYGFMQDWGAGQKEFSEADEYLRKAGIWDDYAKGQRSIIKAANEAIMRPAVAAIVTGKSIFGGVFHGAQEAVKQEGAELGVPGLGREIAAIPEAFPTGIHQPMGLPHAMPPVIAEAKSLDTIGSGEAGYFGTRPVEATPAKEAAAATKVDDVAKPEGAPEVTPSPVAQATLAPQPEAAAPQAAQAVPDIHAVARQIAPDTFREFDALAQKKDTFRRWIDELREVRDQTAAESAPHAAEIADLQGKLEGATPRLAKKYNERLAPLLEERDAYIAERTQGDSADMAKVRKQLMETDYRMRDLAPDVSKAYREAEGRVPQAQPTAVQATEAPHAASSEREPVAAEPQVTEATAEEQPAVAQAETPVAARPPADASAGPESAAVQPAAAPVARAALPIAHAPSIVADVTQKLKAAGRPAEEADAAAQVIAAYWETRAQRFEGRKGTAAEMYAREAPEIKLGKDKKKQSSRELELAQTDTRAPIRHGRIRLPDFPFLNEGARSTITLLKNGDASTFIHETGHEWLGRLLQDARDGDAPATLKQDSDTVLKWLGVDTPEAVKVKQHEKFARGFETYMMEGRAPSQALARVFAKFKDWLTTIYRTVKALKSPISDDIRGVFDRMLAETPERTVIAPERETAGGLAEKHEALAEVTPAHEAFKAAGDIRAERDSHAAANQVEQDDARLKDAREGVEKHPPGGSEPSGDADASRAVGGAAEASGGSGALGAGGSEAPAESARARQGAIGLNKAPTPLLNFLASQGGIKASDALISDLRQALGGKNRLVPGFGQLIRTPKQMSSAAAKAGRLEAMSVDRAREAAIEAGLLPEGATPAQFIDAIENEVREQRVHERPHDEAEQAHAEHNFIEGINDAVKQAGGAELSDAERARALELYRQEGLHDPASIIERLALEADDAEIEHGAPARLEGIPGWDVAAPGWELADDGRGASGEGGSVEGASPGEPGGGAARTGGQAEKLNPTDANALLPPSETRLIDKAGNIRLDNLGTPEDVNAVIRQTAAENGDFLGARRDVIPDAEVIKLADALGMDASKLSERKLGEAFNAEQIVAARKLLIQSAQTVRDAMAKAAEGDEAAILAYAEAKSRHLMIQGQVSGITAEAGRALRAFRALEGQKEAVAIGNFLQDTTGKTLYQLQREAQLGLALETPQQISKHIADSVKPTYKDWAIEGWMAALLSGPRTHVANVLGNILPSIWRPVETATAAGIGKVLGSEDRVLLGEAPAELFGMVAGAREGITAAAKAFLSEEPQLTAAKQAEKPHQKAIPGMAGQIIRTPLRLLGAEDEFFKSVAFRSDIYRQAYVIAAKEGLAPEIMRQRVAELSTAPTDAMIEAAKKVADYQTFQNSLGKLGRAVQAASNAHPLVKVVIPFVRTPLNLLKYASERSPLGLFSQEVRDNLASKNGTRARDTQIARIALGTMVGVVAYNLASQKTITGGGPADKAKRAVMMADGWQPYSVKVGDMYYSYNRLDPFSVTLGTAADAYEIMSAFGSEHPDKEHLSALVFAAISKNVLNRTALSGLSDMIQATSDPERYGKNYIKGLAGSVIPALSAQSAQTLDPTVREARSIIDNFKARTPGLSQTLHPKRDIWGEPVMREGALGPDIASPIAEARLKNDPVNRALLDAGFYPSTLERKINGVDLTDQQYDDYSRIAGRTAKMMLNAFVNSPGISLAPKDIRADKMRDIVKKARGIAQAAILAESMKGPDADNIVIKANNAKTAKFKQDATVH